MKNINPKLPIFLLGHSNGGAISVVLAQRHPEWFRGVVLTGPFLKVHNDSAGPALIAVSGFLSEYFPKLPVTWVQIHLLSRDPSIAEICKNDSLHYKGAVVARFGGEIMKQQQQFLAEYKKINWPFLILHAEKDALSDSEGSQMMYSTAPSSDKTLKILPGMFHEIFNEFGKEEVISEVVLWMKKRI